MLHFTRAGVLPAILAGLVSLVWGSTLMAEPRVVTGTVAYLERIALPPGAVLDVELLDVSRADAPSVRLASRRYAMTGVPFPFSLTADGALIEDRMAYTVAARISVNEKVIYRTTSAYPVLTRGAADTVDIVVEKMPADAPAEPVSLTGEWDADELGGRALITEKRPSLTFLDDGTVGIHSGCNKFGGPVEISGDTIRFSNQMAGTLMACPPPYDKLEKDVLKTLVDVSGYVLTGDQLALVNDAGATLMRLSRRK